MLSRWAVLPLVGLAILLGQLAAAGPGLGDDVKKGKAGQAVQKAGPEKGPHKAKSAAKAGAEKKPAAKRKPSGTVIQPASPGAVCSREAILRALDKPVQLEFVETPLADVVEFLQQLLQVPVCLDQRSLSDVGVSIDTPITRRIRGVSARTALELMLRDLDLQWVPFGEVLLITTPEHADSLLESIVYDVHDLVVCQDEKGRPALDFDSLIELITSTVGPTTWDEVGGAGSIAPFEGNGIAAIAVSQTWQTHEKVARVLADVRKASHAKPGETVRPRIIRPRKAAKATTGVFGDPLPGKPAPSAEQGAATAGGLGTCPAAKTPPSAGKPAPAKEKPKP